MMRVIMMINLMLMLKMMKQAVTMIQIMTRMKMDRFRK